MLKNWLNTLSEREKQILLIALPLVVLLLLWLLLINPALQQHSKLGKQLDRKSADLVWMQQAARQVTPRPADQNNTGSLRQQITELLSRHKFTPSRIQADQSGNSLSLWLDSVQFEQLLSWIEAAQLQALQVTKAQISPADKAGFVSARLTLAR